MAAPEILVAECWTSKPLLMIPTIPIQDTMDSDLPNCFYIMLIIQMKRYLSRLLPLILVLVIGLVGRSGSPDGLAGNYRQDSLSVIET